ncbi:MAG: hypothetical protein R3D56_17010 [Paracoccaceae bacterium]|jgi:hypothetical protein
MTTGFFTFKALYFNHKYPEESTGYSSAKQSALRHTAGLHDATGMTKPNLDLFLDFLPRMLRSEGRNALAVMQILMHELSVSAEDESGVTAIRLAVLRAFDCAPD